MTRFRRRAGAAIALAIAAIRLAHRALWVRPGERLFRRLFYCAIVAIGFLAIVNLAQILTGGR